MAHCGFLGDYLPLWCCHACDLRSDERRCVDRRPRNDPQTLKSIHIGMYLLSSKPVQRSICAAYARQCGCGLQRRSAKLVGNLEGPCPQKVRAPSAPSRRLSHQTAITTLHSKCRSKRPHQVATSPLHPFLSPTPRACSKPTSQTQSRIHTYIPMR
jgi:hypothetical protein